MADLPSDETIEVIVRDSLDSNKELMINSDGSINVLDTSSSLADQKKVYMASYAYNLASSGEKLALYLNNPTGSGKVLKLIDMTVGLTNTVGSMAVIRAYYNPTITANGTAKTISPGYIGGGQAASSMTLFSGASASANGTLFWQFQLTGGTNGGNSIHQDFDQSVILAENNKLLITGDPDGTNRNLIITLRWVEA